MKVHKAKWLQDSEGTWVCFLTDSTNEANAMVSKINSTKTYDLDVKEHREKRSLNANAYLWVLCSKMADAMSLDKEDIYRGYINQRGVFKDFVLTEDEAKTFSVAWGMLGVGWFTERVDFEEDGERLVIRAYYGSSTYNTKQMSRIIDLAVQDAKSIGIETMTPNEINEMLSRWEGNL